jgi:tetratricopeptide (TPR) repeat protein
LKRPAEALASYDRAIAFKPDHAEAYYNRGNILREFERLEEALSSYDRAIALKPNYAEAYSSRGIALKDLKRSEAALVSCDRAIALKPDLAEAHNNRGNALKDLKQFDGALASYDQAIALKPGIATVHHNRANVLMELQRTEEALASYDLAIALRADYAEAHSNRGTALRKLNRLKEALASYETAIALEPDLAGAYANQSLCSLLMGHFEQGLRQYEWRKKIEKPFGARSFLQPLWLGEPDLAGKTLFIHWEQGFGDTIQFCRYAKLVEPRGARVIMSVQQPLHGLLQKLSPTIEIIDAEDTPAGFDYHCPLLSLPLALGTTLATIPAEQQYLSADAELRSAWSARLPAKSKPRIGVVWSGRPVPDPYRSIELDRCVPLFDLDAHWVCLQKEVRDGDLARLRQDGRIMFFGDDLRDFSDTAALLDLMDLVITIDTSVAHLAGAMGKPVWILLPYNPDWRWLLDRDDSPWYPSARLFRQSQIGDWTSVLDSVTNKLRSVLSYLQVTGSSG